MTLATSGQLGPKSALHTSCCVMFAIAPCPCFSARPSGRADGLYCFSPLQFPAWLFWFPGTHGKPFSYLPITVETPFSAYPFWGALIRTVNVGTCPAPPCTPQTQAGLSHNLFSSALIRIAASVDFILSESV